MQNNFQSLCYIFSTPVAYGYILLHICCLICMFSNDQVFTCACALRLHCGGRLHVLRVVTPLWWTFACAPSGDSTAVDVCMCSEW